MSLSNVTDIKTQLDTVEAVWFTKTMTCKPTYYNWQFHNLQNKKPKREEELKVDVIFD